MRQSEIAKYYKVSEALITRIKKGDRHTENECLAIDLSRITKKPAINYITPRLRKMYLKINPALKKVQAIIA